MAIILGSFTCRDKNKIFMEFMEARFTPGSFRIFWFGRLIFPFNPEIRSVKSSFSFPFHLERYLRLSCSSTKQSGSTSLFSPQKGATFSIHLNIGSDKGRSAAYMSCLNLKA